MHKVNAKSILSAQNGMNLYRGCSHGCIYCDSRSTCYGMKHPFEDIEVKINAPQLLEAALRSRRKKCMIGTGAMTDPYLPLEKELCLTRKWAEVLDILRDEGIPTVVWLCPILPFINDTEENIRGVMDYAVRAKVYGVLNFGMGVTLRDGDRQYFYEKLEQHFPGLRRKYIENYGNAYEVDSPSGKKLMSVFYQICRENGLECSINRIFAWLHTFEEKNTASQIELSDFMEL